MLTVYIALTVITSFVCSLMEAVILSVPPAFISTLEKEGRKSGLLLASLHKNIDKPLAAILTLNTIANTVGSIGIGVEVNKIWGDGYLAIVSGIMTFVILIFSEIIPKTLGAVKAKQLAAPAAYIITGMTYITYPFVILSRFINKIIAGNSKRVTTREEMIAQAEIGANEGTIQQKESRIIKNLLLLDTMKVQDIMTPRSVMFALEASETVGVIHEKHRPLRFSRIPVYEGELDNIKGLLHRYKVIDAVSHDKFDIKIGDLTTTLHTIGENTPVSAALDQFVSRREHLFLVVDDYGSVEGIVTLEDTIETLLGVEIVDEYDSVEDMREFALQQWRKKKAQRLK